MWLFEFLLGMAIAYLLLSPRLRHFIFRRSYSPNIKNRVEVEEKRERQATLTKSSPVFINGKPSDVTEEQVKEWIQKSKSDIKG